jgi:hypothetical protein
LVEPIAGVIKNISVSVYFWPKLFVAALNNLATGF